jgi:hypothetical protein
MEYFINFNADLGFESNRTVNKNFNNIDKTVKNKYKEILKKNEHITKEELSKKLKDELIDDKKKYQKGYHDYYNNSQDNILEIHEAYLKAKEEADEKRRLENSNAELRREIDYSNQIISNMRREQEIKEQNIKKMKEAFEIRKKVVEKENLEKSKKYFEKYIANIFLKEFMIETEKKIEFKVSLISRIQNLTQEFMNNCQKFINSFKSNTSKIINEFDIKEIEPIEHINFIVVGKAGVGKSTFINEALLLSEDKRAEEGVGESVTRISSLYTSEKLKMVRMWDTPGLDDKISKDDILKEIQRLIEDGSQHGPDHYINIILYCTSGLDQRFQKEDEELIKAIMKIYPFDNLPVIITQLKSYMPLMAENMEKVIRNVLKNMMKK